MPANDELLRVSRAYADVASRFFAAGPAGARPVGPGWFAALANEPAADAAALATPAGRRLYESIGFKASDERLTRFRGLEDDVLAAIGQPG